MRIHEVLKVQIENYAFTMERDSPLFSGAKRGAISLEIVRGYLCSIHHIVKYTPYFLNKALRRAQELGHEPLAQFFRAKLKEEEGHDAWALEDLGKAAIESAHPASVLRPSSSILKLTQDLESNIEVDPYLYLPYILLTEYFTVLVGPQFIQNLNDYCGISPEMMTVVGKHAELDKEHVQFDIEEFSSILRHYPESSKLVYQMDLYMERFKSFCCEVVHGSEN